MAAPAPRPTPGTPGRPRPARSPRRRRWPLVLAGLLVLALAWPIGLAVWADGKIQHVEALSGTADQTPGTTYLLAGSDARGGEGGIKQDSTVGERSDTIMVLHAPTSGPTALISLPRDTYVEIPGYGPGKLNTAYAVGGPSLLVATVEALTGLHMDRYVEVGLDGMSRLVDAVGGVELCFDPAVDKVTFPIDDPDSKLVWAEPGCQVVDGRTAVAFARMRKADAEGDIGRARRQRQLISALGDQAVDRSLLWQPRRQVALLDAGLGAVAADTDATLLDLARLGLAFRAATGDDGVRGTPPIADPDYRPGDVGSTVLLDPDAAPTFWRSVSEGTLAPGQVGGLPG